MTSFIDLDREYAAVRPLLACFVNPAGS